LARNNCDQRFRLVEGSIDMPPASDWRSAATAEKLMLLDRDQFAIEFLRRNQAYRDDYRQTLERIASGSLEERAAMAELARRWGLSFRA
jgi:hypothetical protein